MIVSLITATFNRRKELETALMSIKNQTYPDLEWVVIDGASNDDTVPYIEANYSGNLTLVSEPDNGIYDALNKGVRVASGGIIGFLHADDILATKDILSRVADFFKTSDCDGVYGDLQYVDKSNTEKVIRYWKSKPFRASLLKKGWMPAHPTLFLKREVYEKHGLFNLDFKIAADYDFMLRILKDDTLYFAYLPQVITKMRIGGASNRSIKNIIQKSKEDYKALKLNGFQVPLPILLRKNLSKIPQFFK